MSDSIRETILAALKTQLQTITVANGYNLTINRVDRIRSNPINHPQYPSINVWEQRRDAEIDPKGYQKNTLDLVLEVWSEAGGEDLSQKINQHIADVEKCVLDDPTLGLDSVIDTYYTGDEVLLTNGDEIQIGAYCFIKIMYRTNYGDPNTLT